MAKKRKLRKTNKAVETAPVEDETITMSKTAIWQIVSGVLGILLVVSVITGGFGTGLTTTGTGDPQPTQPSQPTQPPAQGGTGLEGLLQAAGIDVNEFNGCMQEQRYTSNVASERQEAINNGLRGTPGFIINSQTVSGAQPYQAFASAIDQELARYEAEGNRGLIENIDLDNARSIGDEDAPVVVVEYSDFTCPFCQRFYEQTLGSIKQNYVDEGLVLFVYKDFPVVGGDELAHAGWCADEQDLFWEFHDAVFES